MAEESTNMENLPYAALAVKQEIDVGPTALQPTDLHYMMMEPKVEIKEELTHYFKSYGSEYLPLPHKRNYSSKSFDNSSNSFDDVQDEMEIKLSLNTVKEAVEYIAEIPKETEPLSSLQSHRTEKSQKTENSKKSIRAKRQEDFCYFCKKGVLNFTRHIMRNHFHQPEVQRIASFPKKSKERIKHITSLRKQGNYLLNSRKLHKPMNICPESNDENYANICPKSNDENYVACSFCLGYYKKKLLWRHRKKCTEKKQDGSKCGQVDAQNLTLRHLQINIKLREEVFPHMRADTISLVAKQDPLICAFAANYLTLHRTKQFINVTSRKMRDLAKLLMELRAKEPNIGTLADALQPQYYDVIVEATKVVAEYDTTTDQFKSPTYAMNIGTLLKQCAKIANLYAVKKKDQYFSMPTAEAEAGLRTIVQLLNDNWRLDLAQAADSLNSKRWNKFDNSKQTGNSFDDVQDEMQSKLSLNTAQEAVEYIPEVSNEIEPPSLLQSHRTEKSQKTENSKKPIRAKRQKQFCYFCKKGVLNFTRHIMRNHFHQPEVQRIASFPKKSKERIKHITSLRKQGNYLLNSRKLHKPMNICPESNDENYANICPKSNDENYVACSFCLGYYKKKLLWRHRKNCTEKKQDGSKCGQVDAQNLTLRHLQIDIKLREQVFPHMRADTISLVAKQDPLICAFAANYLTLHRTKQFINVTSRKMRDLAKLLMELRAKEPNIGTLADALQPQYYDVIVEATKVVAEYDTTTDQFKSPTYAMNIGTLLKQCAKIANLYDVKKKDQYFSVPTAEAEAGLRTIVQLLNDWRLDLAQAADSLNLKTLVPLASDLKLLKEYLVKKAKGCADAIKLNIITYKEYNEMVDYIYCRVLLLNRITPGELQTLRLDTYNDYNNVKSNYEEFDKKLSHSERVLLRTFKKVVIRGKRNQEVLVLFSTDTQEDIKLLLSPRNIFISQDNPYLFAKPGGNSFICGRTILIKNANECGAKHPDALSATGLRSHLATLTQIFYMTNNDLEQLSSFMGYRSGVHKKSHHLPDDVYETSKMYKLLEELEGGKKSEQHKPFAKSSRKRKRELVPWTEDQKTKAKEYFKISIMQKNPPKKNECEDCIARYPEVFHNKNWHKIKVYIQNIYTKKCAMMEDGKVDQFKCKSLDKIDLNLDKELEGRKQSEQNKPFAKSSRKSKRELVPWTEDQKTKAKEYFTNSIMKKIPPKKNECEDCISRYPEVFHNKNWHKIKCLNNGEGGRFEDILRERIPGFRQRLFETRNVIVIAAVGVDSEILNTVLDNVLLDKYCY